MPIWLIYTLCSVVFLIVGFISIWAIREGGSFAFLSPSYWRQDPPGRPDRTRRP